MVATASARSVAVSCCAARGMSGACSRHANASERVDTRIIYLLLFVAPQALLYLYLRERLPDPAVRGRARVVRRALAALFVVFNLPWLFVAQRVLLGGSVWGVGRVPFTGPWIAWQLLGWIYCALVTMYVVGKAVVRGSRERDSPVRPRTPARTGRNRSLLPAPFLVAAFSPAPRMPMRPRERRCRPTASGAPTASPRSRTGR